MAVDGATFRLWAADNDLQPAAPPSSIRPPRGAVESPTSTATKEDIVQVVRIGLGISKRGDRYLRTLMIHGARAALSRASGKQDPRSLWLGKVRQRRHPNVAAVALANQNARIVWAILTSDIAYEPTLSVKAA
jgi:hypothetical protein